MSISICYLTWKRHEVFRQTLQSHRDLGLFDLIPPAHRIVFAQERSAIDDELAAEFNLQIQGAATNVGIAAAFVALVKACVTEYMIFCENDWMLLEPFPVVQQTLRDCIQLTAEGGQADIVRLRHLAVPGNPLLSKLYYYGLGPQLEHETFRYKLESLSWVADPTTVYESCARWKEVQLAYKWFVCSTADQSWSNNVFFARTAYLRDRLSAAVEPSLGKLTNNYGGLEILLQNPNDACTEIQTLMATMRMAAGGTGLFTHADRVVSVDRALRATDVKARSFLHHLHACRQMVAKYADKLMREDLVLLDVGANVGYFSLALCEQTRGAFHKLILFEPCKEYADYAGRILQKRGNVVVHSCGLGETTTQQHLYKCPGHNIGWNTFLTQDPNQGSNFVESMAAEVCEVRRLDDFCIPDKVHFVKIDVEGYECKVLEGAMELLRRDMPCILVEVGWGTKHPLWSECEKTYEKLFELGYRRVQFSPNTEDILFVPVT